MRKRRPKPNASVVHYRWFRTPKREFGSGVFMRSACCLFAIFLLPMCLSASTVFALDNSADFGTLDLNTGVFSEIGNTGLGACAVGLGELNGTIYTEGCLNNNLYAVNTGT